MSMALLESGDTKTQQFYLLIFVFCICVYTMVQRRKSGLKSGGSWIRVKKSIFSRQIDERIISIFRGKLTKISIIFRQKFPNGPLFSHLLQNVRLSRQNLSFRPRRRPYS